MSDDDSSSSEDLPLSALGGKKEVSSEEEEFEDEDSDEDDEVEVGGEEEPDSEDFIVEDSEEDDDADGDYTSDTSDDAPLTSLKSKKTPPKKVKAKPAKKSAKKATPKKKAASAKKKKSASTKKAIKAKQASSSTSTYLCPSGELYAQCDKGKLIQSLLARWWYAYQWPDPKSLPESTPKGYDALDGFPGVYICTQGGDVGKFLDYRDHTQSPSFNNLAKKSAEELQGMLLRAIQEQMEVLIEHEGKGTDTEKNLKVLEKWAEKLNCSKADKDAAKVLKAKRLVLS